MIIQQYFSSYLETASVNLSSDSTASARDWPLRRIGPYPLLILMKVHLVAINVNAEFDDYQATPFKILGKCALCAFSVNSSSEYTIAARDRHLWAIAV